MRPPQFVSIRKAPLLLAPILLALAGSSAGAGHQGADMAIAIPAAQPPKRLFISGHSLTNRPFPDRLSSLADQQGGLTWDMHHANGSTLEARSAGTAQALAQAAEPYDTLILTEQHSLLESLIWNDTIGQVVAYDARLARRNSKASTYLFSSWLHLPDRDDPRRWIEYEMVAADAWRCTAAEVNRHLGLAGRRIRLIPAAEALADLVRAATGPEGIAGLTKPKVTQTMSSLFVDDVHPTPLASHYVAIVTHLTLYGRAPGLDPRAGIDPELQLRLARQAAGFLARADRRVPSQEECRRLMSGAYARQYLSYVRDTSWRSGGTLKAYANWARYSFTWPRLLRSPSPTNPFGSPPTT